MKSHTLLLIAALLAFPWTLVAETVNHHHDANAQRKIELNAGRKWATDEPLRTGMTAIKALAATALPKAHAGKLTSAQYDALANDISAQLTYIVQNCKLDPRADAQLHIVIGDIAQGVETMQGKLPDKGRPLGVVEVSRAMNTYGEYFNHPGWQAIKLPQ